MKNYLRFIKTVLLHKWYVFVAGRRLRVPLWRLLIHDLSKFSLSEFGPYARHFYGGETNKNDFTAAWNHHKLHNSHHWEYWISVEGNTLPMPIICVHEMVADWFAAGKAYNGSWPNPKDYTWYKTNRPRMNLHQSTEFRIGLVLAEATKWQWK
jgi:hypothetical protein